MPLTNKYLKYSPEINLEIFTLIWNKLKSIYKEAYNDSINVRFDEFKAGEFVKLNHDGFLGIYSLISGETKTTVQEILGYDPFIKEEVIPEYVELLEGFDNTCTGKIFNTNQPIPQISGWSKRWTWESIFKNNIQRPYFKPSTKEAFDAQNKPIEKWSVGSYVVFLKDNLQANFRKRGDISEITHFNINTDNITFRDGICNSIDGEFSVVTNLKWFATKSEAEEFAKTLVEPVKDEVKQPLKQAVHCKSLEEYKFLKEKISTFHEDVYSKTNNTVKLDKPNSTWSLGDCKNNNYQILSFQEWCDLNGYKMEKEVKFEVGKWYKYNKWYLKYLRHEGKIFIASEYISDDKSYDKCTLPFGTNDESKVLASIEEIQQYLPDDHPDKIKSNQEFKVGEYIFVMIKDKCYGDILKIISVESDEKDSGIKGTVWIEHENSSFFGGGFRLGSKYRYNEHVRHATPEEINNHLISIGQIPAGEPLNSGIEPNKDGAFKYTTYSGTTHVGKTSTISGPLKMTLSIDDEELPMVNIIKTNTIKQLLNND